MIETTAGVLEMMRLEYRDFSSSGLGQMGGL